MCVSVGNVRPAEKDQPRPDPRIALYISGLTSVAANSAEPFGVADVQDFFGSAAYDERPLTPYLFQVLLSNREEKTLHHDHLKPFRGESPSWIKKEEKRIQEQAKEIFCICRQPDDGTLMVQCEICLEWFHCHCLGITKTKDRAEPFRCRPCREGNK